MGISDAGSPPRSSALAAGQLALWFLEALAPGSGVYNLVSSARVRSAVDPAELRRTFQALADRHASLRTTFELRDGEPTRQVHGRLPIGWVEEDVSGYSDEDLDRRLVEEAYRPFVLASEAPMRVGVFRRQGGDVTLLVVLHHLVADFGSLIVVLRELGPFYTAACGGPVPEL
ncbi:MAG TPA: condensation domain-containing protein, partial [Thermoanaerobaculia bacterium]|nr:condensation domain-containing protein [Thermoanaerobaculia bacterium]